MFYGTSDDLIEVEGSIPGCDEYPGQHGIFEIAGLTVEVDYMDNGCWGIRTTQIHEDVPVTVNKIVLDTGHRYSMQLRLTVPQGSYVTKKALI